MDALRLRRLIEGPEPLALRDLPKLIADADALDAPEDLASALARRIADELPGLETDARAVLAYVLTMALYRLDPGTLDLLSGIDYFEIA